MFTVENSDGETLKIGAIDVDGDVQVVLKQDGHEEVKIWIEGEKFQDIKAHIEAEIINKIMPRKNIYNPTLLEAMNEMLVAARDHVEGFEIKKISDGFHDFEILYEYRLAYNALLFNEWARLELYNVHKSRHHFDGEVPFGNPEYFIVCADTPLGQISNHYKINTWHLFKVPEAPKALSPYDGHTPE